MPDDDDQMIIPSHGPYKGQRIQVSADEAKRAVKEGWARDAYAETVEDEKQPEPQDDETMAKQQQLADAAAKRWRGEEDVKSQKKDMHAGQGGQYETRAAKGEEAEARRGPGRPPNPKS
jgi:hypothetical protein